MTDTRGYVVRNARVFILGVPYSRVGHVDPQTTGADGADPDRRPARGASDRPSTWCSSSEPTAPDDKLLAGVSTRRLVQATGPPA